MAKKALIGMILASLLISCSLSHEEELVKRTLDLPDLALVNAEYVLKDDKEDPIAITAGEILLYDQTNTALITDFTFVQRDSGGTITLSGRADSAEANTKSLDARLIGSVTITDHENDLVIMAEELTFLHKEQLVFSGKGQLATILYSTDKRIEGYGLDGDLSSSTFSFEQIVTGVISQ